MTSDRTRAEALAAREAATARLLAEVRAAAEAYDESEVVMEARRAELAEKIREAKAGGLSVYLIEKESGYSHNHVYQLMRPAGPPRTAARREQRRRARGES
jgi:hypothetical protein